MDLNAQKEAFQRAYVLALAAQAGFNPGGFAVDDDSVDVALRGRGYMAAERRNPQIEFQLKCTGQDLVSGDFIKFKLPKKNYEDLRGDNLIAPRYLAVLLVPQGADDWVVHHDNHIALHNSCFWVSLRNSPASANDTSVTVDVPLSQRLTTNVLRDMMEAASRGEAL